jgi:alpha-L-fucosidase
VHWGVYSLRARGEWTLENDKITLDEYAKLPASFYPVLFNATEWVLMAKKAGMKYVTFTAKHHDGFAMWHTKQKGGDVCV